MDVIVGNRIVGFLTHSSESILAFSQTTRVFVIYWGWSGRNALADALFNSSSVKMGQLFDKSSSGV